ncbi:hypothetical protein BDU57DRAFT_517562 [Ampelomyces quisqualis]|uniref:Regulator of chromosome condensation 1/beta-lactamase-inhibitor protein II n=1 Tax=Ampelomyces quisqualis TaxID=50730 RepID=A0A6A5QR88_AMPQU|nr:hypothetical protein BDU57DRAFT_517562 [Ampelomyces quisqualis]
MKLYAFGYLSPNISNPKQTPPPSSGSIPTCILEAHAIKILWSSWCDVLIAYKAIPEGPWAIDYRGTSLSPAQEAYITNSPAIKNALGNERHSLHPFGSDLHHGLQGCIISDPNGKDSELVVFSTAIEIENGAPALQTLRVPEKWNMTAIHMDSRGDVLAAVVSKCTGEGHTSRFTDLKDLHEHLEKDALDSPCAQKKLASFSPAQWRTNRTTSIALNTHGHVFTASSDSRYQKCLGRPSTHAPAFEAVPYFEETRLRKIAAGGYMVAAISSDDELFLWGQANPGCHAGLSVLGTQDGEGGGADKVARIRQGTTTRVSVSVGYQDEVIKSLEVFIDGEEARPYDVVIGNGHVIVAAEVQKADGTTRRAVLGAGSNDRLQTGVPLRSAFVQDFEEIVALGDTTIEEMVAAGWTTFVVTSEN